MSNYYSWLIFLKNRQVATLEVRLEVLRPPAHATVTPGFESAALGDCSDSREGAPLNTRALGIPY